MTDKQLAIKVAGIVGATKISYGGIVSTALEYSAEYNKKRMQAILDDGQNFYDTDLDSDFVEAAAKGEIEIRSWVRSCGWDSVGNFLYGGNGRESVFKEILRYLPNLVRRDTYAKLAEIGSINPQTEEELEFYLDLYFGENEKKAA